MMNPHVEFFDGHDWGYSVVEFTREARTYVGYAVDETVDDPSAEKSVVVAYRLPAGVVNLEDVTDEYA